MTVLTGGLRDRMVIQSFTVMLEDALSQLGWFDTGRAHQTFPAMRSGPLSRTETIPYNQLVLSFDSLDPDEEQEIGSDTWSVIHAGIIDFYAEPGPGDDDHTFNGGESLGKHVIGDCRAIIAGEMPEVGRDRAFLDVYDYRLATPDYLFTVEIPKSTLRTGRVHHVDQPWERYWYTCGFELLEIRSLS